MTVSEKKYEEYIEKLKSTPQCVFYPKWQDIKTPLQNKPEKYISFVLWILHTAPEPVTEEEIKCRENLEIFLALFLSVEKR